MITFTRLGFSDPCQPSDSPPDQWPGESSCKAQDAERDNNHATSVSRTGMSASASYEFMLGTLGKSNTKEHPSRCSSFAGLMGLSGLAWSTLTASLSIEQPCELPDRQVGHETRMKTVCSQMCNAGFGPVDAAKLRLVRLWCWVLPITCLDRTTAQRILLSRRH